MNTKPEEILFVEKPTGITSFDVIRILRKKIGIRKMGHAGTLDPMATGLMIIGVGEGTKKLQQYLKLDKTYEAEIVLGYSTDTGDILGEIIEEKVVPSLSKENVLKAVESLKGIHSLPVPLYSAVKREGRALYSYARSGERISPPIRDMEVLEVTFFSFDENKVTLSLRVRSGVYVRSVAELLGRKLGTLATLSSLRRTSIGDFSVQDAQAL